MVLTGIPHPPKKMPPPPKKCIIYCIYRRLRRWHNIETTFAECYVFAGSCRKHGHSFNVSVSVADSGPTLNHH